MRPIITLSLLLIGFSICYAQDQMTSIKEKTELLDAALEKLNANQQFNGTLLIAEKGKVVYEKIKGIANVKSEEPLKASSSYRLASVSKQFIGMGIMVLQEAGKLDYEDDIQTVIPELPYKGITIRNLLNHTGGLPDYMGLFEENWDTSTPMEDRKVAYNKDVVALMAKLKPEISFQPNEKFEYSNTGYVLLGEIIERVSGKPVQDFLYEAIFKPAGMTNTRAFRYPGDFGVKDRVYGFTYTQMEENDHTFLNGMVGDGGIYATAADLLAWSNALNTEKLVKQTTLEEAFKPVNLSNGGVSKYGFGWGLGIDDEGNLKAVSHSGGWVGFRTYIHRDLEKDKTLIVLTNHSSRNLGDVIRIAQNIWAGKDYELPKIPVSRHLAQVIAAKGEAYALEAYQQAKLQFADEMAFNENHLNELGYNYLSKDQIEAAIQVFLINVMAFPKSSNVYDSAGEAYLKKGDKELAKLYYTKAFQMDPSNDNAQKILADLGVDTEALSPKLKLTPEELERYVGVYEIVPAFKIEITVQEDRIFAQATGQGPAEIFPMSQDKFFLKVVNAQLSFSTGADGKIERLTLHQNGAEQIGKKIE